MSSKNILIQKLTLCTCHNIRVGIHTFYKNNSIVYVNDVSDYQFDNFYHNLI